MRNSWVNRKSFFPFLLCFILMMHLGSFFLNLRLGPKNLQADQTNPMIVKIQKSSISLKRQIVQSEDSESTKKMDDSFLGDKDRFFDRETRAKNIDTFRDSKASAGGKSQNTQRKIDLSDLAFEGSDPFQVAAQDYIAAKNGQGQEQQAQTVSSTNDYLEDIPLGDVTHLNTAEYKFYGFYHRIRQKLEQFWGRSLEDKAQEMLKKGRRLPGSEEMITALQIVLDSEGEIRAIKVLGSSGVKELDDAAIESFNEAGPFPNPPKDLLENGLVTLEWGFVVKS